MEGDTTTKIHPGKGRAARTVGLISEDSKLIGLAGIHCSPEFSAIVSFSFQVNNRNSGECPIYRKALVQAQRVLIKPDGTGVQVTNSCLCN
jgi:hypothetical protein